MKKLIPSIGLAIGIGIILLFTAFQYRDSSIEEKTKLGKICFPEQSFEPTSTCNCTCPKITTTTFGKLAGNVAVASGFSELSSQAVIVVPNFNMLDEINSSGDDYVVNLVAYHVIPGWIFSAVLSLHGQVAVTGVEFPQTHILCTFSNQRTSQIFYTTASRIRGELVLCNLNETLAFVPSEGLRIGFTDKAHLHMLTVHRETPPKQKVQLGLTTMAYNEGKYLKEWILYHKLVGVEKFWIVDNNSDDETSEVLQPFVESGLVEVVFWPWKPINQPSVNNYILYKAKGRVEWLSWTDSDLFFLPVFDNTLLEAISRYSQLDILYVFYISFGTSGYQQDPPGLVTELYTWRQSFEHKFNSQWMSSGSSWMRPSKILACKDSHFAVHIDAKGFDPHHHGECCDWTPWYYYNAKTAHAADVEVLRANHYAMKSLDRFNNHKKKLWDRGGKIDPKDYDYYDEEDYTIIRFVPRLREEMGLEPPGEITLNRISNITRTENLFQEYRMPLSGT